MNHPRVCSRCHDAYANANKFVCAECRDHLNEKERQQQRYRLWRYWSDPERFRRARRDAGRRESAIKRQIRIDLDAPSKPEIAERNRAKARSLADELGRVPRIREVAALLDMSYQTAAATRRKAFGLNFDLVDQGSSRRIMKWSKEKQEIVG